MQTSNNGRREFSKEEGLQKMYNAICSQFWLHFANCAHFQKGNQLKGFKILGTKCEIPSTSPSVHIIFSTPKKTLTLSAKPWQARAPDAHLRTRPRRHWSRGEMWCFWCRSSMSSPSCLPWSWSHGDWSNTVGIWNGVGFLSDESNCDRFKKLNRLKWFCPSCSKIRISKFYIIINKCLFTHRNKAIKGISN